MSEKKKNWLWSGTKYNNTSSDISLDHSDAFGLSIHASVLKKKLSKEDTPGDILLPVVAPPIDGSRQETTTLVGDH